MTKKEYIRMVFFLLLVFMVLVFLSKIFQEPTTSVNERLSTFKSFEDDMIDGVWIGTSGVDRYWIAGKAFEDYGMAIYTLSTDACPSWLIKNLIVESLKTQNPKLLLVDMRPFTVKSDTQTWTSVDVQVHRVIDKLPFFSLNRMNAILRTKAIMKKLNLPKGNQSELSLFFPFIRYHCSWEDGIELYESENTAAKYLGMHFERAHSAVQTPILSNEDTEERLDLDQIHYRNLIELLDYLDKINIPVIFVDTPRHISKEQYMLNNTIRDILDERGYIYYIFSDNESLSAYDLETDFYNDEHVNFFGAEKFTNIFSSILNEKYNFQDHRNDIRYQDWFGGYDEMKSKISQYPKE